MILKKYLAILFLISLYLVTTAQSKNKVSLNIQVNEHQTTHLIFPQAIIYFDVGDVQHYIAEYTNNILRIKGLSSPSNKTNLTVITADKQYYSFYVFYKKQAQLNYFIHIENSIQNVAIPKLDQPSKNIHALDAPKTNITPRAKIVQLKKTPANNRKQLIQDLATPIMDTRSKKRKAQNLNVLYRTAQRVMAQKRSLKLKAKHQDIKLTITGVYHSLDHCYIRYEIKNEGAIPYDIAYVSFIQREKKQAKKSALNEKKLQQLFTLNGDISRVLPYRINRYVVVLNKLAVPKHQICYMELIEAGRNLKLNIPFNHIKIETIKEF